MIKKLIRKYLKRKEWECKEPLIIFQVFYPQIEYKKTISYHFAVLSYEVGNLYGNLSEAFND